MGDLRPVSLYRSCTKRGREELSRPIYPDNLKRARAGNRRHQDFQSRSERRAAYLIRPQAYLLARRHRIKTDGGGSCRIERCKYGASRPAPHGFLTALACSSRLASRLMSATDSSASSGESSINLWARGCEIGSLFLQPSDKVLQHCHRLRNVLSELILAPVVGVV